MNGKATVTSLEPKRPTKAEPYEVDEKTGHLVHIKRVKRGNARTRFMMVDSSRIGGMTRRGCPYLT